jgi:small subunit ribosomal protein S6
MFIVKATNEADTIANVAKEMQKLISDNKGKVVEFKELGEKKLAYPIKKEISGYYYVMQVEGSHDTVAEFDRKALLNENVLRHLTIRIDEE